MNGRSWKWSVAAVVFAGFPGMAWAAPAEENARQLRIPNLCHAQSVRVSGLDAKGQPVEMEYEARPDTCVDIETKGHWWQGAVKITVVYPDGSDAIFKVAVPEKAGRDSWQEVAIPPLEEVIRKAAVWIHKGVKYGSFDRDPNNDYYNEKEDQYSAKVENRDYYRADCSGYVSYVWGLDWSMDTVAIGKYAKEIPASELRAGDAVNNNLPGANGHVVLFVRWRDRANGEFWAFEQSGSARKTVSSVMRLSLDGSGKITELKKKVGNEFKSWGGGWFAQRKP